MKTVSNRQLRRTVVAQQNVLEEGIAPALREVAQHAQETRDHLEAFRAMTFLQRLRWFLKGAA